ncbi:TPA: SP_1767 family glycosyltransferase [Streptococcus suis]|nr:SP_1767 family glycosyltransferase [Streptococcus suis]
MSEMEQLYFKVKPIDESLDFILENNASVARFGDGEFDILSGQNIPYQDYSEELAKAMREILAYKSDDHFLVCLPDVFEKQDRYNDFCQQFWQKHLNYNADLYRRTCTAPWYGSTFISRPYIDLNDKTPAAKSFEKLKSLWQGKDLLIVEGFASQSGVGNDLFAGAHSIERILCPAKNAFSKYDEIADAIRQYGKGKLVLLMLGPTAKVLSFRLSQEGMQLIDLGHIDSEYEWFKMGATTKVKIPNKHTAEFNHDMPTEFVNDEEYKKQIILDLSGRIDMSEKVSVIVPVYNSEKYLKECVDSILRQTYTNIEVLLINDGSTDGSARICEEYKECDSRVRVHHKINGGVGSARNAALELATGDYILFVDNDDWLDGDHIEQLYLLLKKSEADIAIANFTEFREEIGKYIFNVFDGDYFEKTYTPDEWFQEEYRSQFHISQCFTVPWCKLYKASLFEHVVYPVEAKVEDDFTTYKVYLMADKIAFMNKGLYVHRKRETSVTSSVESVHVFPLKSIEERITLLSLLGKDISNELTAYRWRLHLHKETLLEAGDIQGYREVIQKLTILDKHKK